MKTGFFLCALVVSMVHAPAVWAEPAVAALCDAPVALHFTSGQSSGMAQGGIPRGDLACWTVSARAGQSMSATVSSTGQNAGMQVYQPGWKVSKVDGDFHFAAKALRGAGEGDDATRWTGVLPASGAFLFVLGTTSGGGDYTLKVSITAPR